jgi:diguanylate cyclase (GGDEF)-like protein
VVHDPVVLAYVATAVVFALIAVVTWRRRAQNPIIAAALTAAMTGAGWWSVALAVAGGSTNEAAVAIATLAAFFGADLLVAAFACLGLAIARPQWVPQHWLVAALLVEPVLMTLATATNPWHQLVYGGAGAGQLTGSAGWTRGPVFWLDNWYCYLLMGVGLALIGWGWWKAPPALRAQRGVLLVAAVFPLAANALFLAGGFGNVLDPTPLGFAVTGTIMGYAIFQKDLFRLSPVARALIIDQIGDAVMVISPGGRFLDLNPAAVELVRAMNPDAPANLVGAPALGLVGEGIATTGCPKTELVVERLGGRAEFEVHASALIDRRHRALGTVYVARDVSDANALSRRLATAHTQLIRQVETIDRLRANLVEQATRDVLTGLHNRRHLVERFSSMIAEGEDAGEPVTVALFDIDRFKCVNDVYGHLTGDAVLVAVARLMGEQAPAGALVARWGGEEFFIALPRADAVTGLAFADDLRRRCERARIVDQGRMIHCTVSGGVATSPASGTTMDELFHAADVALYEAKDAGRNLVRLHPGRGLARVVDAKSLSANP